MGKMSEDERKVALIKAISDTQAIFRGDCARCHVDKGRQALGQDLYAADCGICHESSQRAKFVPDLHALKKETDLAYWKGIITFGKARTMMPAFAAAQGGPLSEEQINSLATYLDHTISHHFSATVTNVASATPEQAAAAR
jgi:mono/diheme cytochrome c family protein